MAKPIPKKQPKFRRKAGAREKSFPNLKESALVCGADISMSSVALAGLFYDETLNEIKGPGFSLWRWESNTHYFDRIEDVARSHNFILDLMATLNAVVETSEIYIAVEEPWPFGMVGRMQSNALKQQAEISGAFLGGLLRYGLKNIFQIPANSWRQIVAAEAGITIHHTKWNDPKLCEIYNCKPKDSGKFRAKEWALTMGIPDWPDIIQSSKLGKIPRPEGSRAKAVQADDRYDALAVMEWMRREFLSGLDKPTGGR